ncbi:hypothetical protein FOA43_003316 [Brettanomyces nanus]|uniref:GRIP domain-containing protein n=1 Tax=Eeniella nana TaxID=13502 RepID=A0A875RQ55_EENNA|nr:uncharacterized protein FOA43_003316 [Brettanomyces nanus]QPG75930.1 hypothetical protein FOA43_003316 [Brettanomyces nanus]
MLSRISQLSKNLTDEISRFNDEVSSARVTKQQQDGTVQSLDPERAAKIMSIETPDPATITKPSEIDQEDNNKGDNVTENINGNENISGKEAEAANFVKPERESSVSSAESEKPSNGSNSRHAGVHGVQKLYVSGTKVKFSELPNEIVPLLLKFSKYERLYPQLYQAYKVEKEKSVIIKGFETVLKETTPCTGISEMEVFKEYLEGLSKKADILSQQLREKANSASSLKKEKDSLLKTVNEVRNENKDFKDQLNSAREEIKGIEKTKETLDIVQKDNERLEKEIRKLKQEKEIQKSQEDKYNDDEPANAKKTEIVLSENSTLETNNESLELIIADLKKQVSANQEEIENLRDMLRDVGDELVESQKKVKRLENGVGEYQLEEKIDANNAELEILRIQNAEALKDYEQTKRSLTKKYQSCLNENDKLRKQLDDAEKEKEKLDRKINDLQEESQKFQREANQSNTFKENGEKNIALVKAKEKEIGDKANRIEILQEEKDKLNEALVDLRVQVKQLEYETKISVDSKEKIANQLKSAKSHQNEMELRMNKVAAENNKLVKKIEELQDKYSEAKDYKTTNDTEVDSLKRRIEEALMRSKEYESRIDVLEEELSQSRSMLQERTREAGTMRKLVMDTEQNRNTKIQELEAKLDAALEEKDTTESTSTITVRESQKLIEELRLKLRTLNSDCDRLKKDNANLEASLKSSQTKPKQATDVPTSLTAFGNDRDDDYTQKMTDALRASLKENEQRLRKFEEINKVLQRSSNDNAQKLVRMNKKYKLLTQQYKILRSSAASGEKVSSYSASPGDTDMSSGRRESIASSIEAPTVPTGTQHGDKDKEKSTYIKNVLFGFLEHRDQREMLLPVMKALLGLDDEDEKKFMELLK